jgi:hypothetical protein
LKYLAPTLTDFEQKHGLSARIVHVPFLLCKEKKIARKVGGALLSRNVGKTAFRFISPLFDSDFVTYQFPRDTGGFRSHNKKTLNTSW